MPDFERVKVNFKVITVICRPVAVPLVLDLMTLWSINQSRFERCAPASWQMAEAIRGSTRDRLEFDA